MKLINKVVDLIEEYALCVFMVVMTGVVIAQIVLRTTGGNLKWTEETARYLFAWVIYLGAARSVRNHAELSIDMVRGLFKDGTRALAFYDLIRTVLCVVFAVVFARYSFALIQNMMIRPQYSPACKYNMIIVYLSSFVAALLMIFRYVQEVVEDVKKLINPAKYMSVKEGDAE